MKAATLVSLIVAMSLTGSTCLLAQGPPKPEEGMILGEVIDIANFAMRGNRGEEHAAGGQHRAGAGFPIGILEDETGRIYVAVYRLPVPAAGLQTANSLLGPLMGKKVVVQGLKYHAGGINVVRISLVSELDADLSDLGEGSAEAGTGASGPRDP